MRYYEGPEQFRPLTAWAYVGYSILFAIPVIGWLFLIIFTFSGKNINRRSFARSIWIFGLLLAVTSAAAFSFVGSSISSAIAEDSYIGDLFSSFLSGTFLSDAGYAKDAEQNDPATFQEAMDSYEAFFDDYIAFMANYDEKSDVHALAEYTSLLMQYADTMEKLEAIDEDSLSEEDLAYYLEVTTRIYAKLATVE